MAVPSTPSLEERMRQRRGGNPQAVRMLADLVLGVVLVLVTISIWSPSTATKAVGYGLKVLVPVAALLLILRAFQRDT